MSGTHPPKVESFDTGNSVNTDPKGFARPVDAWGHLPGDPAATLYMARPADHPRFGYLESWLLPRLDLRVNRFHFRNGTGHGPWPGQELYVDIALVDPPASDTDTVWRTTDLYIDVVTYAADRWEILDLDELGEALVTGHLDTGMVQRALTAAQRLVTGMAATGSVEGFLHTEGFDLTWSDPSVIELQPAETDSPGH